MLHCVSRTCGLSPSRGSQMLDKRRGCLVRHDVVSIRLSRALEGVKVINSKLKTAGIELISLWL